MPLNPIRYRVVAAICFAVTTMSAWGTEYISPGEWPDIQRGIQVTQYAKLAGIVDEFDRSPDANIVILYPGGKAGHNWAVEIRNWFVALGIASRKIALRPGSGVPGSLGLQVEKQGFK
ncbi:MAG: hypothetical protein MAG794_01572 [Gammaproteobacteria bacterium]|nr:hypothetical protein [Gammaproteobacteria bacterium]